MKLLARFWFGGLAWARIYRRLELVELELDPPPTALDTPLELDFGFLAAGEDEEARTRLARGDRCYVAREQGAIVSSRWIAEGRAWVTYLGMWIDLGPDEVYLSETYTIPSRRGHGVSGAAGTRLGQELAAEGRRRILAGVLPENYAGRRAYEKAGYRGVGWIGFAGIGLLRKTFERR